MSLSCIVLSFTELSQLIDKWRIDYLGIPPHITLLYPWRDAPLSSNDLAQLELVLDDFEPFELCLNRVETFEAGIIYLALKDDRVPKAMMQALFTAFPDTPPYGGAFADAIPHLTVAKCQTENLIALKRDITEALSLPIELQVNEVVAMEYRGDNKWVTRHTVSLRPN